MERWVAKLIALIIIFLVTFFGTLLPIKVTKYFERQGRRGLVLISYMMCFGGGVFFAIYLLHMSPDVHQIMNYAIIHPNNITYPLTELIISAGFFVMLFMEKVIQKASKTSSTNNAAEEKTTYVDVPKDGGDAPQQLTNGRRSSLQMALNTSLPLLPTQDLSPTSSVQDNKKSSSNGNAVMKPHDFEVGHSHLGGHSDDHNMRMTRSLVLLMALSLHHVFEGMTVGLKHTEIGVWNMCIAIVSHEVVVGFSLGLQLLRSYNTIKKVVIAALLCALMTPLGVIIGMSIMETGGEGNMSLDAANGILQGLATGVFIYVTFFEILYGEITHHDTSMTKLLCLLMGFACMALLGLIPEETTVMDTLPACSNAVTASTITPATCVCP
ncbi:hypothetical protein NP493_1080g00000 [Ridgeia piscesae]|uniref:Zinc transporter ZIP3 n=1 Tax=Ridgeia piscesae TaxID=27915 RepID=A0AAD9KGT5_RIDPI|nr:hypothetical protein NP493_1080g00000 [Ridgeia piscesae]